MFDFSVVSDLSVKGFTEAVTAYSVLQVKEHPEKLRGIEGLRARMIGREHEFADLRDATDAWLHCQGQIASIIGEAGIGKSRLVRELREYLKYDKETGGKGDKEARGQGDGRNMSLSLLEGRCVSIGQPISYWPFLDILRTYFGLGEEDNEATRASKVTEPIHQLMPQGADETLPLLGVSRLLGIYAEIGSAEMMESAFSRAMQALGALDIDENSQARGLFMTGYASPDMLYQAFQRNYAALGKESELPDVVQNILKRC
jgi:hypothetical protein